MNTKWAFLTILGLLLMWPPGLRPAWAQATVAGEVSAYGNQSANYGVGVAKYNLTGYLMSDGTKLVPTTPDKAEATYSLNIDQALASGDMTSYGEMITKGKGVDGSFVQTQSLNLSIDGKFKNCPEEPFSRKYSGTQTLEGHTTPAGGDGELHGYGNQTVSMSASCISATLNSPNQDASNQSSSSGNNNGSGNGRLILNVETSAYSVADRTGPGVAGTFTQTHTVDVSPQSSAATPAGVTGSTNVSTTQWSKVSTGN